MTSPCYRALSLSGILHGLLIAVLLADFTTSETFKMSGSPTPLPVKPVEIVQAVAMDQTKLTEAIKKLEMEKAAKKAREVAHQRELERQAKAAEQKRIQEQERIKEMKVKADAEMKKLKEEKLAEIKKLKEEKIKEAKRLEEAKKEAKLEKEKLEKKRKQDEKKAKALAKLHEEQAKLAKERAEHLKQKEAEAKRAQEAEQKRIQEAEAKRKEAALAAAKAEKLERMQGELNRYKSLILQTLSQNWITPDSVDKNLKVEYQIRLAPGGAILDVTLLKSSGNEQLDRSARVAIYKSSPLPVPSDADLFNLFRVVHLTVRPEGFVTSG